MQKKMIFFDIDGTLVNGQNEVPESTKQALIELEKNGHEIAIATGRNLSLAQPVIDLLGFKNYVICNGAAGYYHHERVCHHPIDKASLLKLLATADELGHQMIVESDALLRRRDEEYAPIVEEALATVGATPPPVDKAFHLNHEVVQCLHFYPEADQHHYEDDGQFPLLKFVRWHPGSVDVLPHGGSKAKTIMELTEKLGIQPENIYAFGDGLNDVEMLSQVHHSVAMGNATDEVKKHAKHVTTSVDEDGIFLALKKLNLI
ncbi:Cof-type HAD-IIB family hydrolase [Isobaculum melis]|uniref:Cof subfamily of IIB subfamily of haloacid dehalogenase superfamily/HAD-superfamily hydrolase, subfamily IIB n=1 Tax=Isobaculum melis TaxID=142588 RepID=A0A1H9QDE4_9LACT|nr:Cof-type HAD-IIB family hydrolase [Isobaculum melis]SER58432.1 hypothetical protein SAMN04488559_1028 [Isobaculum melis]